MIHKTSIKILSEIGMHVFHQEARSLLQDAGAVVDGNLVKVPERMVDEALRSAPSKYSIYNVDGSEAFCLAPNVVTFGTGTDMPEFIDLYSGEIRPGRLEDCENAAKIAEHCKPLDWLAPYALANDKNQGQQMYTIIKPCASIAANQSSLWLQILIVCRALSIWRRLRPEVMNN